VSTSFAVADDGGHGKGRDHDATTTAATSTTGTTTETEHGRKGKREEHGAKKVTLCHKAGRSGRWVKVSVSRNAVRAHTRHGDVAPDSAGACPAPAPATPETTTTTSTTTTTTQ
jgi:hypothetical protein